MFKLTCTLIAAVTGVYGLAYSLLPGFVAGLYLTEVHSGAALLGRYFGVTLLFIAVACWLLKDVADPVVRNSIATAGVVNGIAGLVVSVVFTLNGVMTAFGWSAVVIYLSALCLWLLVKREV